MPKRKRPALDEIEIIISRATADLTQVLRVVKGFERQRQSKKSQVAKVTSDAAKVERLEKEALVLKSIDLQTTASAHVTSSILRVKALAQSPSLPEAVKNGSAKPPVSEEERVVLHNVTSALYNYRQVREIVDKLVKDVCEAVDVPLPQKKVRQRPPKDGSKVEGNRPAQPNEAQSGGAASTAQPAELPSSVVEPQPVEQAAELAANQSEETGDDDVKERAVAKFEALIGVSSDEDDREVDWARIRSAVLANPPKPVSSSASVSASGTRSVSPTPVLSLSEDEATASEDEGSPMRAPVSKGPKKEAKPSKQITELPSLMGGYISGSESASEIDEAPALRKNRRGQRARQAIWEKKFQEKARHLSKPSKGRRGDGTNDRDVGWDARRGAVETGEAQRPWKQGVKEPLRKRDGIVGGGKDLEGDEGNASGYQKPAEQTRPNKDIPGQLHPSWEAARKAKEAVKTAAFAGKKIVFD